MTTDFTPTSSFQMLRRLMCALTLSLAAAIPSVASGQAHRQHHSASASADSDAPGTYLIRHAFPSALPQYSILLKEQEAGPKPADLGSLGSCRSFGTHTDGDCLDLFVGGKVVPLKSKSALQVAANEASAWRVHTEDGRTLTLIANPNEPGRLDDGSHLERYVFETRFETEYRSPVKGYRVSGLQSNPDVTNGAEQLWGLRKVAPNGDVLWDYVYLSQEPGAYIASTGEIVGRNPIVGLNDAIFPPHASFALMASTANLYRFAPKAKVLDPESLEAASKSAFEISLSSGQPASPRVAAIDYKQMSNAYREQLDRMFKTGAFDSNDIEKGAAGAEVVKVLDNSDFHDRVAKVIKQFFQSGSK